MKNNNKYFELNLPNTRSEVPEVEEGIKINQPTIKLRCDIKSYLKPKLFDIVRMQIKEKTKENLKYFQDDPDELEVLDR